MNVRKDDRVSHTRFGPGVVIDVDWRYTIIEFDEAGVRKFVSTLVQLERCELPLPVKPAPARRRRRNDQVWDLDARAKKLQQDGAGSDVSQPETTRPLRRDPRVPEESTKL